MVVVAAAVVVVVGSFCNGLLFFYLVSWKDQNQNHHTRIFCFCPGTAYFPHPNRARRRRRRRKNNKNNQKKITPNKMEFIYKRVLTGI